MAARAIDSLLRASVPKKIYLLDNSDTDKLRFLAESSNEIEYIWCGSNLGFGKAHNIALQKAIDTSPYHLILNPDVYFNEGVVEALVAFMNNTPDVGLVIPKVLGADRRPQSVCKRLPTPLDLIIRRSQINMLNKIFAKRLGLYEMRDIDMSKGGVAPFVSGCFMFLRTDALKQAGLFDERFFMYMEDTDLSRRIRRYFKTYYFPDVEVVHEHARESYKFGKQLIIHSMSAIKYFTKWGWISDSERDAFNDPGN